MQQLLQQARDMQPVPMKVSVVEAIAPKQLATTFKTVSVARTATNGGLLE